MLCAKAQQTQEGGGGDCGARCANQIRASRVHSPEH